MPPNSSSFTPLNVANDAVPEDMGYFTLAAPPNTDLWRKPPSRETSTAPILYTALRNPFISAEVTVTADWELEWDQGGLVIFAGVPPGRIASAASTATATATTNNGHGSVSPPNIATIVLDEHVDAEESERESTTSSSSPSLALEAPPPSAGQPGVTVTQSSSTAPSEDPRGPPPAYQPPTPAPKWVKVGLEFCNNACHATSVCATSDGADWALTALSPHHDNGRRMDLRVKIERIGYALWVWYQDEVAGWKKLREVTYFFWGVEDKAVRVGVYASRPANVGASAYERRFGGTGGAGGGYGGRNLCVCFEGLEIQ